MAGLAKILHNAEVKRTDLPRSTEPFRAALPKVDYASAETIRRISDFMDALDEEKHYVHGDYNPNNIIVTDGGPMLIDMGGFSAGCPMFDLATLRFCLFESPEARSPEIEKGGRSAFNGMTWEEALAFWQGFEQVYFDGGMDEASRELLHKVTVIRKMRFERIYGMHFPEEYCEDVRQEVLSTFGNE